MDDTEPDRAIPFLDTIITQKPDETLTTPVQRKPTHTDQYLHRNSQHHIPAKMVSFSHLHRGQMLNVCSTPELLRTELQHLQEALINCKCLRWALNGMHNETPHTYYPKHHLQPKQYRAT